jgi:hypothetical protein
MDARVVIAEDDEMQADLVRRYLEREDYDTFVVHDGRAAIDEVRRRPDLLDEDDRDLVALRRADSHRLGIALQLCTVRYVGLGRRLHYAGAGAVPGGAGSSPEPRAR